MFVIEDETVKAIDLARYRFLTQATQVVKNHLVFEKELLKAVGPMIYIVDFIDEGQLYVTAYREGGPVRGQRLDLNNNRLYANRQFWGQLNYEQAYDRVRFRRKSKKNDEATIYTGNRLFSVAIRGRMATMPTSKQINTMFKQYDQYKV